MALSTSKGLVWKYKLAMRNMTEVSKVMDYVEKVSRDWLFTVSSHVKVSRWQIKLVGSKFRTSKRRWHIPVWVPDLWDSLPEDIWMQQAYLASRAHRTACCSRSHWRATKPTAWDSVAFNAIWAAPGLPTILQLLLHNSLAHLKCLWPPALPCREMSRTSQMSEGSVTTDYVQAAELTLGSSEVPWDVTPWNSTTCLCLGGGSAEVKVSQTFALFSFPRHMPVGAVWSRTLGASVGEPWGIPYPPLPLAVNPSQEIPPSAELHSE